MFKSLALSLMLALSACAASPVLAQTTSVCEEGNKLSVIEETIKTLPAEAKIQRITDLAIVQNTIAVLTEKLGPPPFDVTDIDMLITIGFPNNSTLVLFLDGDCNKSAVTLPTAFVERLLTSI